MIFLKAVNPTSLSVPSNSATDVTHSAQAVHDDLGALSASVDAVTNLACSQESADVIASVDAVTKLACSQESTCVTGGVKVESDAVLAPDSIMKEDVERNVQEHVVSADAAEQVCLFKAYCGCRLRRLGI